MEPGVGNDSQTTGMEPALAIPLASSGPWIQLLNVIDPQDAEWPLINPMRIQTLACVKCPREFSSVINFRRHVRLHRKSVNDDKEFCKNRDLLGAFWDKISPDESKKILSFDDVNLDGLSGDTIIKALESIVQAPGYCGLPQAYVKAGDILLIIIQTAPSGLSISSGEFFSVLDDASEGTFLSSGTAESVQKYIFDGVVGKVGLEVKNLIACTSFLLEQKLVKAWISDKDAEALRCQKLLVEEEEAAQKRQAELLERKRQKKLRQKDQKTKEQSNVKKTNITGANMPKDVPSAAENMVKDVPSAAENMVKDVPSAESSSPTPQSETDAHALDNYKPSLHEPLHLTNDPKQYLDSHAVSDLLNIGVAENVEIQKSGGSDNQHIVESKSEVLESKVEQSDVHPSGDLNIVKPDPTQKHALGGGSSGENCVTAVSPVVDVSQTNHTSFELMIGSIPVTLGNSTTQNQPVDDIQSEPPEVTSGIVTRGSISDENQMTNLKSNTSKTSSSVDMIGKTVSERESEDVQTVTEHEKEESEDVQSGFTVVGPRRGKFRTGTSKVSNDSKRNVQPANLSTSHPAKAFLTQRRKDANTADHDTLVVSKEHESQGHGHATREHYEATTSTVKATQSKEISILGGPKRLGMVETKGNAAAKSRRKKTEKVVRK